MKKEKGRRVLIFAGLLLAAVLAAFILYEGQLLNSQAAFLPGTKIASMAVDGKDKEQVRELLEKEINKLYQTQVRFTSEADYYDTNLGAIAEAVDVESLVNGVWEQETKLGIREKIQFIHGKKTQNYPITLHYKKAVEDKLVSVWNQKWGTQLVEAHFEFNAQQGFITVPGKAGREVDAALTFAALPQQIPFSEPIVVPVQMREVRPQIDAKNLKNMGELASFVTYYKVSEKDRSHNLTMAANGVNGSVVQAGQTFSFNRQVGMRSTEKGYRDAMVIVEGKFVPGLGGGICQVSSTLYNACLLAGLEVVERYNHALAVSYVPLGRDATVVYGIQDLRIKNNTASPVYFRAVAGGGVLRIIVYGNLANKQKIQLRSITDKQVPFETVVEQDSTLAPGQEKIEHQGALGYVVRSFRDFYAADGTLTHTQKLATDSYRPLDKLVKKGPEISTPQPQAETPVAEPDVPTIPVPETPTTEPNVQQQEGAGTVVPPVNTEPAQSETSTPTLP